MRGFHFLFHSKLKYPLASILNIMQPFLAEYKKTFYKLQNFSGHACNEATLLCMHDPVRDGKDLFQI